MIKQMILPALALLASAPAFAQPAGPADEYVLEMRDAVAAAALPLPAMDARLISAAADAAALPPGWKPATAESWAQATTQSWQQQGWQQPPPVQVMHSRQVVPVLVPVPVGYGGWGGPAYGVPTGWGGGWNRGWRRGGWNGGWGPGVVIGGYGRGWGRCRNTGSGALLGGIAGASIGYGLGNRWDRTPGVIIGGLVGALAGSAIERSGC